MYFVLRRSPYVARGEGMGEILYYRTVFQMHKVQNMENKKIKIKKGKGKRFRDCWVCVRVCEGRLWYGNGI